MLAHPSNILPFAPRPVNAMQAVKDAPQRGGTRQRLPYLTIDIPNFQKYQKQVKGKRRWMRIEVDLARDGAMREAFRLTHSKSPKNVFEHLIGVANNEGHIEGLCLADAAADSGMGYRTIINAIDALAKVGLITGTASDLQVICKSDASQMQVISLEDLKQSLGMPVPTRDKGQGTDNSGDLTASLTGKDSSAIAADDGQLAGPSQAELDEKAKAEAEAIAEAEAAALAKLQEQAAKQAARLAKETDWLRSALPPAVGKQLYDRLHEQARQMTEPKRYMADKLQELRLFAKPFPQQLMAESVGLMLSNIEGYGFAYIRHVAIGNASKPAKAPKMSTEAQAKAHQQISDHDEYWRAHGVDW